MENKSIIIKLENYKGKNFTFTMPTSADVSMWMEVIPDGPWVDMVTGIGIEASYAGGIAIKEEEYK